MRIASLVLLTLPSLSLAAGCAGGGWDVTDADTDTALAVPDAGTGGDDGPASEDAADASIEVDGPTEPEEKPACQVLGRTRVTGTAGKADAPALLWNGSAYLLVWSDGRAGAGRSDVFGAWIAADGKRMDAMTDLPLVENAPVAISPEITPLPGRGYMLVWESCQSLAGQGCAGKTAVGAMPLGMDGRPAGTSVSITGEAEVQRRPYVVTTANGVAHVTFRDVVGTAPATRRVARVARLSGTGALDPAAPVLTLGGDMAEGLFPHLAVSGDRLAAVHRRTAATPEIVFTLIGPMLTADKELIVRKGSPTEATNPVLTGTGTGWTVAWEDWRMGEETVYARIVAADGSQAMDEHVLFAGNGNWPGVSTDGKTSVVSFYGFRRGAHVLLALVDPNGNRVADLVQLTESNSAGRYPAVAYNGRDGEYGVVWQEDASGQVLMARVKCP